MNIHHTRTRNLLFTALLLAPLAAVQAVDYPYQTAEPQKTGWPLTAEERAYITEKPEHDRRPGRESNKHLPKLWPVVPSAGHFGGDSWLKLHEAHVKTVQANKGKIDVLLVGDSITIQWGESWKKHFPDLQAVNIGIGGDKTQNVLWRLDHGGVEGLQPQTIVLMIGNNNMFFTPETGIEAAAQGIEMCVKNLREKFPDASIIVAKILPAHAPGNRFYEDIRKTNAALDPLKLDSHPKVQLLDLWSDFTHADGTLKKDLFTPDNIHLSPAGYAVYAASLRPMLAPLAVLRSAESAPSVKPQARTGQSPVEGPAPPRWFNALGTYGRNVLMWGSTERPDHAAPAVVIERREGEDGTWHTISPEIRDVDRWFDDEVHPGRSYSYRAYSLTGALDAMIEHNFARLKSEYVVDPYRVAFEEPDPFLRSAADLKRFVRQHGERLLRLIEQERNRKARALSISEFSFGAESGWVELHNRGPESVSLRGYLLVTKGGDGNREFPLSESEVLKPNSYTVLTCPRNARVPRASSSRDREEDDSRAASIERDSDVAQPFPGFDPAGGFIALVRRHPESRLERREDLVDFWHYGPQQVGRSYGRFGGEFAGLEPTPGRANIRAMTR